MTAVTTAQALTLEAGAQLTDEFGTFTPDQLETRVAELRAELDGKSPKGKRARKPAVAKKAPSKAKKPAGKEKPKGGKKGAGKAPELRGLKAYGVETTATAGGAVRMKIFGLSATAVLRWLGSEGWSVAEARAAMKSLGLELKDVTVKLQVGSGRAGDKGHHGEVPELTKEQAKLMAALKPAA